MVLLTHLELGYRTDVLFFFFKFDAQDGVCAVFYPH